MKFDEWFSEQFGPDPVPGEGVRELDLAAMRMRGKLHQQEEKLRAKRRWSMRRDAALKAWVARDDDLDIPAPAGREE